MRNEDLELATPILFVDDDAESRRAFARAMNARGFDVHLADGAEEAIALSRHNAYALIATDLHMPETNGIELVECLRTIQPDTSYLLVTGVADLSLPRSLSADRIVGVVTKPWDSEELADTIWRSIELGRDRESGWYEPATNPGVRDALGSVLVLEDNPKDPDFMLRSLVEGGLPEYQVIRARRLAEASRIALDRQLQVIVTELSLPDARGLDAIFALSEATPTTPIVAVGAMKDEALALRALAAGAQDYLIRGQIDPTQMRRSLRFAIERKRAACNPVVGHSVAPVENAYFGGRVASALSRAKREKSQVAVLYLTLARAPESDHGESHPLSGTLLGQAMERARATLREYDTIAYLGDQRVGIILEGVGEGALAGGPAERIVAALGRPFRVGKREVRLGATLGISLFPGDAETEEELCRCADMAGYRAQAHGSGAYEFFDESRQQTWCSRSQLLAELSQAIEELAFELDYRFEHDLESGRVVAAECSAHWRRSNDELWPEERFSAVLQEQQWSPRLTSWILKNACRHAVRCRRKHAEMTMSVTLDTLQLLDPHLPAKVRHALEESGLPASALEISVRERSIEDRAADQALSRLAGLGVSLTLSDFASEASVARLSELPLSALRIGPSLGDLAGSDARSAARLRATAGLSRALNLRLRASGVDGPGQREFLMAIGCERGQGNLYGSDERPAVRPD